jgi:hypothetical protein
MRAGKAFFFGIVLFGLLLLLSCGSSQSGGKTNTPRSGTLSAPQNNTIYFGAFADFGGSEDQVTHQKIANFEKLVGKKIAWAYFSQNWYSGIKYPKNSIHTIYESGSIPFVRLMPRSGDKQYTKEKQFSLENIINGMYDDDLIKWAEEAKLDGIPLLIDFAVEPNGDWFGWSGKYNGAGKTDGYGDPTYPDGPERYRDAYRHIIDIFRGVGASKATWFFHFNYISSPKSKWNQPYYYYPGDDYIDWIGFSLYGVQDNKENVMDMSFATQLASDSKNLKTFGTTKPVALLEFGVSENPKEDKDKWIREAFNVIMDNPYITFSAISVWHENWKEGSRISQLRIDSSEESLRTFKDLIKDKRFISKLRFK